MSKDSGPSSTAAVAARMDKDAHYANAYRGRLIDAGVIEAAGRGYVDFAIPYLREYLRSHLARIEMSAWGPGAHKLTAYRSYGPVHDLHAVQLRWPGTKFRSIGSSTSFYVFS
jgi:hypothetical protein